MRNRGGVANRNEFAQDYKAIDVLKLPAATKIKVSKGGQDLDLMPKFVSVKHDVEIDASKFANPAE
jgi:hypothetical protein